MPVMHLYIRRDDNSVYEPIVCDGIQLESEREGSPAKLTFTVIKDQIISFPEGAPVALYADNVGIFEGFIFEKSRDKEHHIQCVAYDQLRYLKNTDTYVYTNLSASDLLKRIAKDFDLKTGVIADTGYKIKAREEIDVTLFDIIMNALDLTYNHTKERFVLYDDFGKLTLKNIKDMSINLLVDESTAENFNYTSSIDEDTYNQILIQVESEETKGQKVLTPHFKYDNKNIKGWGVLQYSKTYPENSSVNFEDFAQKLLELKNRKTRRLEIKGVLGDINVRAGCSLPVHLNIGDIRTKDLQKLLVCNRVTHYFNENDHVMDLTLWDGDTFVG